MTTLTLPPHNVMIVEAKSKAKFQHRVLAERPKAEVITLTPKEIKKPDTREKYCSSMYWSELGDFIRKAKR